MNVGELRELMLQLDSTDIPDSAPVMITGRHSLHTCRAEVQPIHEVNRYGQAQYDGKDRGEDPRTGPLALVFLDTSTG